jgi:hypothetical protein
VNNKNTLFTGNWPWGYLYKRYPGSYFYPHWQQTYNGIQNAGQVNDQQQGVNSYASPSEGSSNYQQNNEQRFVNNYEQGVRDSIDNYQSHQGVPRSRQGQGSTYGAAQGQAGNVANRGRGYQQVSQNYENAGYSESIQSQAAYPSRAPVDNYNSGRRVQYAAGNYQSNKGHEEYYRNYYKINDISNIIGGAVSLDGRPLGYPFDRQLAQSAFDARNVYVQDVVVYHIDEYFPQN